MPRPGASLVSPSRRAALQALSARPSKTHDDALPGFSRFRTLDPRDQPLAERLYRGVLQNLRLIDLLITRCGAVQIPRTSRRLLGILRIAAYQKVFLGGIPDYAIGQQAVEQAREEGHEKAARFMNAAARRMIEWLPDSEAALDTFLAVHAPEALAPAIRYSVPDDIAEALSGGYGALAIPGILAALNQEESRVWLRVNTLRTTPAALTAALESEGVSTEPSLLAPTVLRWIPGSAPPWRSSGWERGELTVQDLGAFLAVEMLAPTPGETVIDWCAAPGGKSGQIWERMRGEGRLIANEIDPKRRKILAESLDRLHGSPQGIEIPTDDEELPQADAVLVDAPCMALGLIRRHPEIRWDNRIARREHLTQMQKAILKSAAEKVAPGGRLAWVTCSPTLWENEQVIAKSEISDLNFQILDPLPLVPDWAKGWIQSNGTCLRTRPDLAPVDGFAIMLLRKI